MLLLASGYYKKWLSHPSIGSSFCWLSLGWLTNKKRKKGDKMCIQIWKKSEPGSSRVAAKCANNYPCHIHNCFHKKMNGVYCVILGTAIVKTWSYDLQRLWLFVVWTSFLLNSSMFCQRIKLRQADNSLSSIHV